MLESIFVTVLKMSITASVAAVVIILFRWMFGRRLPKALSYALWAIVLVRLLIPFSMSSSFSIFNAISVPETLAAQGAQYTELFDGLTDTFRYEGIAQEESAGKILKATASSIPMGSPEASADPIQIFYFVAAWIWLIGAAGLFLLSIFLYNNAARKLDEAVLYKNNELLKQGLRELNIKQQVQIFISSLAATPVVCGLIKPRVILPEDLVKYSSEKELRLIITHELVHIKRFDYIVKPLAVLVLCLHWFNPFVWISFILFQRDMEMSCDARVLAANSKDIRSEYANSLINSAARHNVLLNGGLLAFGEKNIKGRVKGIMEYKSSKKKFGLLAIVILVALAIILLTNGLTEKADGLLNLSNNSGKALINDEELDLLLQHRSKYIGDASNVGNLLSKLPYGKNLDGISLQTENAPYGITVNYKIAELVEEKGIKPVLIDNALLLFGLIENVDVVSFRISSPNQVEFQFTRAEMQKHFDRDIWAYSADKRTFEEYLLNISFDVLIFPETYSPAMSSVPGMGLDIALNAAYYKFNFGKVFSVEKGVLRTWIDGKLSEPKKEISAGNFPVYWSPEHMTDEGAEENIKISIVDEKGNVVIEKKLVIVSEGNLLYRAASSPFVLTYDYSKDGGSQ